MSGPARPAGSLSAPGTLSGATPVGEVTPLPDEPLAELAARYGLRPSNQRPTLLTYSRQLWQRRHFILTFATARNVAMYTEARLGQLWQVLTPLLNAGVYFLIFGVLLGTSRGVPNYLAFLVTGVFIFNFTQRSFLVASRVINDHLSLIRALHFPRACLPLGYVVVELQQLMLSMLVLFVIVIPAGEPRHLVLAAPDTRAGAPGDFQCRWRDDDRAHRCWSGRPQPVAAVPAANLDVRLRRPLQP